MSFLGNTVSPALTAQIEKFFEQPQQRFLNRELSWLEFNTRVLEEANNPYHPLLERVNFLAISASNLDEFYMVRVAGLKDQVRNQIPKISQDGLTAAQQLDAIQAKATMLMEKQRLCWQQLQKELAESGVQILSLQALNKANKEWLRNYFLSNIFPAMTPIAVDPAHPFPFLPNLSIAMVLQLRNTENSKEMKAIILFPQKLSRFIQLPGEKIRIALLEDVIDLCQKELFPQCTVLGRGLVRITRDSDVEVSEKAEDLMQHYASAVERRRRGVVIRMKVTQSTPEALLQFVAEQLGVTAEDIVRGDGFLGFPSEKELMSLDRPDLKFPVYSPRFPERINDFDGNCFAAIKAKDIVVHHPYESFDVVVRFLQQAAQDPDVIAIKQTLYRTSSESPIVRALIEAAEAGKSVTALVELRARFDEEANIRWARNLEQAGAQVVFGFVGLKTHAKISLVVKRNGEELESYVHYGTGNYHPITAKVYSDLSFFTSDPLFCRDATYLFNYLTGYAPPQQFEKIIVAPLYLRKTFLEYIEKEIAFAKAGKPASIWAKMNSLIDGGIIDALYRASQAGVKIDLVVRGVCALRPGIKGFSENITVKSMVGRFLEHTRIYCFGDGNPMPSPKVKVFIASADWMTRNLDRRVEVMIPIENPTVHEQVIGQIMTANMKDEKQSWKMNADGSYTRVAFNEKSFSAHEYFMTNPSLSGRGKAKKKGS